MNYLAVDTSGAHLTVIVIKNEEVFCTFLPDGNLKHSITMMPEVENLLIKANLNISEIDVFSAVIGPGSFTGIRIGVSAIKAFAYAFNKPVIPVTSFDVLAYNKRNGKRLAVIDAMHDNFYVAGYNDDNVTLPPSFITKNELINLSYEYEVLSSLEIDGVKHTIVSLNEGYITALKSLNNTNDIESLVPLYVRKSQAEEGR